MKHLGRHLDRLRACFARMPDPRRGDNRRYAMADIGMAALSVFLMQSPSFLAHQRALAERRTRSNAHTLFGMDRVPCDNHVRQMLDGVPTAHFDDEFHALAGDLDAHGALDPMRRLGGRVLVALDGTEYFRSRSIHCGRCSTRKRRDGGTEYFHQMLGANIVAPGMGLTLPLPPEFVSPQDGADKQDCERQAVKRWLARHGGRTAAPAPGVPRRRPVRLPAGLPGHARRRRRLPAHLQAAQPQDPLRVPSTASACPRCAAPRAAARSAASTATAG